MKKFLIGIVILFLVWKFFSSESKADWDGQLSPSEPVQASDNFPLPWTKDKYTFTPMANYHIKAVVLSKHHYWAIDSGDELAPYDLALGWGPMSDAKVINQLKITQDGRWYNYYWKNPPPIAPGEIAHHSANTHIIASDRDILKEVKSIKRFDVVDLEGYLVNISREDGWHWQSSLSRDDTGCEVFWVNKIEVQAH